MTINDKQRNKLLIFGAIIGLVTPFLLQFVVRPILDFFGGFAPQLSLKLAEGTGTISVAVRESLTGINGGLAGWLVDALGLTVSVPGMTYIMAAIGGAILILVGAYTADALNMLNKGNDMQKTRIVIFLGSAIAAIILGGFAAPEVGLTLVNTLIAFGVNAAILAWAYVWIDKQFKIGLIPF